MLPALLVLWIRKAVPEPEEWHEARRQEKENVQNTLRFRDLFRGSVRRITILTLLVCALGLSAHWAFMFWCSQHLRNLPELREWTEARRSELVTEAMTIVMVSSILGNFLAAVLARIFGYRRTLAVMSLAYFGAMFGAYCVPRTYDELRLWLFASGMCSGLFALYTMYLPPLFPTLLRTTGAGFCYNFGRVAAAFGTVFFGLFTKVGDYRLALLYASFLFLPAALIAAMLPESTQTQVAGPVD